MAEIRSAVEAEPEIGLRQLATKPGGRKGYWRIVWSVQNRGLDKIEILAVRLPHGQFKADEHRFEPALVVGGGESAELQSLVHCDEPEGLVTENAFVIFSVRWLGTDWRIFARIRVIANSTGAPECAPESITTQKVGFSELTI